MTRPASGTCRRIALNAYDPSLPIAFSGQRLTYEGASSQAVWIGALGHTPHAVAAPGITVPPVFAGARVAYGTAHAIRFVGGGSITPHLPAGATLEELAAHGNSIAIVADWGNFNAGTTKSGLFVYRNGTTKMIDDHLDPNGQLPRPVWSPNGTRLAYTRGTDIWTIQANGSESVQISRTPTALEGGAVWSPDSQQIAYWSTRNGPRETYSAPAGGGTETRLTRTREPHQPGILRIGTQPGAWRGNQIAVTSDTTIGTIPVTGGAVTAICRQPLLDEYGPNIAW